MPTGPFSFISSPGGSGPSIIKSVETPARPSSSRAAANALASCRDDRVKPFFTAHSSTAKSPFTSVAVVKTGAAPNAFAKCRASALAPPICPAKIGTTKLPFSSITRTGGSSSFPLIKGAMERTAMPAAPIKTNPSPARKSLPVTSFKDGRISIKPAFSDATLPTVYKVVSRPEARSAASMRSAVLPAAAVKKNIFTHTVSPAYFSFALRQV